jgi:hypothetical protein
MEEKQPYPITEAVRLQRSNASLRHGGQSEYQIRPVARAQKRRLMRQIGMRIGDLDGVANAHLDGWARAQAKVQLMDAYFQEKGFIREDGEPEPASKVYFAALNSARLSLTRFSEYMKTRAPDRDSLDDYITENYGNGDEG